MKNIIAVLIASIASAVAATNSTIDVMLEWDPNPEPDIAGYTLYHKMESGGTFHPVTTVTNSTRGVVKGVMPGTTNWFAATAFNTSGLESDLSIPLLWIAPSKPSEPKNIRIEAVVVIRIDVVGQ